VSLEEVGAAITVVVIVEDTTFDAESLTWYLGITVAVPVKEEVGVKVTMPVVVLTL
jgi:hypothetical protein